MADTTDYFVFFILLLRISVAHASEPYCVSKDQSSWAKANKTQTLVTPDINYNEQNLSINIDIDLSNKQVWIGYFKALTAFEYFGCVSRDAVNGSKAIKLRSNGPGLCFSACGQQMYVGLRSEMCYCIGNKTFENPHLANCDMACNPSIDAFLCGGNEHISLYKINKEATISTEIGLRYENKNKCVQTDISEGSKIQKWMNCATYSKSMCTFANGTILSTDNKYLPWQNATQRCFKLSGYATNINNLEKLPIGVCWSGVIRSDVIYKYDEAASWSFSKTECGYTDNTKEVLFTDKCNIETKFVLCDNETRSPMTTAATLKTTSKLTNRIDTTTTKTRSPMTTAATLKTTSKLTNRIDTTTTGVSQSSGTYSTSLTEILASSKVILDGTEPSSPEKQEKESTESDVGVVIGSTIVSLLVVIAVVAVIVFLKRRKKLPSLCKEAVPGTTFGNQQSNRTIDEMTRDNHDYDHANFDNNNFGNFSSESNYAHTYFVLEQHANESNTDNRTYDTSGNANKTKTEQDNVYNKIELVNNATYDHAITKVRYGLPKIDDTYDTTVKAAIKLKATRGKDLGAFGETDEDAYNHITSKPVKNAKTENDYGVINTLENEYGDVVTHNKNNNHDEGDTYSHINKIS